MNEGFSQVRLGRLHEVMAGHVAPGEMPGLVTLVSRRGEVETVDDLLAFGQMMLANGQYGDERLLSRPSIALMTTDQITPEQKAASASDFFAGFWDSHGWGFGVAIDTQRDVLAAMPGRYGWDGGYGTSWYVDPGEELIGILMTQRVWDATGIPKVLLDFWTGTCQALAD